MVDAADDTDAIDVEPLFPLRTHSTFAGAINAARPHREAAAPVNERIGRVRVVEFRLLTERVDLVLEDRTIVTLRIGEARVEWSHQAGPLREAPDDGYPVPPELRLRYRADLEEEWRPHELLGSLVGREIRLCPSDPPVLFVQVRGAPTLMFVPLGVPATGGRLLHFGVA